MLYLSAPLTIKSKKCCVNATFLLSFTYIFGKLAGFYLTAKGYGVTMKKAGVCGHFGFGRSLLNGQTVKTKNVTDELQKYFGDAQVAVADSCGGIKAMPRMAIDVLRLFKNCENIIMMPANRGLRVFAPLFLFYNKLYHRRIHSVSYTHLRAPRD